METEYYEDQVAEAKTWRKTLPEDLRTMTPRTQAMHDTFAPEFTPEYCYEAMLDHARQIELELNSANGRILELTTKTPPHECPQESVTSLAANHPNLAEYLASLESRLARRESGVIELTTEMALALCSLPLRKPKRSRKGTNT